MGLGLPSGYSKPMEVAATRTPISAQDLFEALAEVWPSIVGGTPSRQALLTLLAQSAFETGQWTSAFNYNLGGIKHVTGDGRDFFTSGCSEVVNGVNVPQTCTFRAFATLSEGASDYLSFLHKRFANAWPFVEAGDPAGFVHALKSAGYFTGSENDYVAGVTRYFNQFDKTMPDVPTTPGVGAKSFSPMAIILGGLALGVGGYLGLEWWNKSVLSARGMRRRRYA